MNAPEKSVEEWKAESADLQGSILAEIENLVAALSVVASQLEQVEARGEMHQLRSAVCGISRALDREIARQG